MQMAPNDFLFEFNKANYIYLLSTVMIYYPLSNKVISVGIE